MCGAKIKIDADFLFKITSVMHKGTFKERLMLYSKEGNLKSHRLGKILWSKLYQRISQIKYILHLITM